MKVNKNSNAQVAFNLPCLNVTHVNVGCIDITGILPNSSRLQQNSSVLICKSYHEYHTAKVGG